MNEIMIDPGAFRVDPPTDLVGNGGLAVFDQARNHRFWLVRIFDRSKPLLVVCMFNPSDADETMNDPTILTLLHFARFWGYGGLLVVNLHSYVTSQPTAIKRAQAMGRDTCPSANLAAWRHAIAYADERKLPILVAWGNLAPDRAAVEPFADLLKNIPAICLGKTQGGQPKHPLARGLHRVPRDLDPQPYDWEAYA